jgi:putative endonuclease
MAPSSTGTRSRDSAPVPCTERRFTGHQFEAEARERALARGYRILRRNWRLKGGEIDLLLRNREGALVVVEVRGTSSPIRKPSQYFDRAKATRVQRLAATVHAIYRESVRAELWERTLGKSGEVIWKQYAIE